jgi:hypothetical protein
VSLAALEGGLAEICGSPKEVGRVEVIACRPAEDEREVLAAAQLDPVDGLAGDGWRARGSSAMADGSAHPDRQLTLMNARVAALVAVTAGRWPAISCTSISI